MFAKVSFYFFAFSLGFPFSNPLAVSSLHGSALFRLFHRLKLRLYPLLPQFCPRCNRQQPFRCCGFVNCRPLLRGNVIKIQIHVKANKLVDNAVRIMMQYINIANPVHLKDAIAHCLYLSQYFQQYSRKDFMRM